MTDYSFVAWSFLHHILATPYFNSFHSVTPTPSPTHPPTHPHTQLFQRCCNLEHKTKSRFLILSSCLAYCHCLITNYTVVSSLELIPGRWLILFLITCILFTLTTPPMQKTLSQNSTIALKLDRHVFSLLRQRTSPEQYSFFGTTMT